MVCWRSANWLLGSPRGKKIAAFDSDGWQFLEPKSGMIAWVKSDQELFIFGSEHWSRLDQAPSIIANAQHIGIGTTADPSNRLAIKSEAAFLSSEDGAQETPGFR